MITPSELTTVLFVNMLEIISGLVDSFGITPDQISHVCSFIPDRDSYETFMKRHGLLLNEAILCTLYTSNLFYSDLNRSIRDGNVANSSLPYIEGLRKVLKKLPDDTSTNLFRGMSFDITAGNPVHLSINSFVSFSQNISSAANFVGKGGCMVLLHKPSGGKNISDLSVYEDEGEVLFPGVYFLEHKTQLSRVIITRQLGEVSDDVTCDVIDNVTSATAGAFVTCAEAEVVALADASYEANFMYEEACDAVDTLAEAAYEAKDLAEEAADYAIRMREISYEAKRVADEAIAGMYVAEAAITAAVTAGADPRVLVDAAVTAGADTRVLVDAALAANAAADTAEAEAGDFGRVAAAADADADTAKAEADDFERASDAAVDAHTAAVTYAEAAVANAAAVADGIAAAASASASAAVAAAAAVADGIAAAAAVADGIAAAAADGIAAAAADGIAAAAAAADMSDVDEILAGGYPFYPADDDMSDGDMSYGYMSDDYSDLFN
jgi:hypothetical protein